jgi:hypothetical protein
LFVSKKDSMTANIDVVGGVFDPFFQIVILRSNMGYLDVDTTSLLLAILFEDVVVVGRLSSLLTTSFHFFKRHLAACSTCRPSGSCQLAYAFSFDTI